MKILVTNDDGIFAPGIRSLANALASFGEVHVVAPTQEQSGTGHAITVHRPLRLSAVTAIPGVESCHMLDGTPADCVKMAIQGMGLTPDIVVSGINLGANLGTDVLYSGTVSAAIESVILGIPAIAVSLCGAHSMLSTAEEVVRKTFLEIKKRLPSDGLLNINVPALPLESIKGIKATTLGIRQYNNTFEKRLDPRGVPYYWMGGNPASSSSETDNDHMAIEEGFVSVTPIHFNLTYYKVLKDLKDAIERPELWEES